MPDTDTLLLAHSLADLLADLGPASPAEPRNLRLIVSRATTVAAATPASQPRTRPFMCRDSGFESRIDAWRFSRLRRRGKYIFRC
jgi:hypothetical protein